MRALYRSTSHMRTFLKYTSMFVVGGCLLLTILHWDTELFRPYSLALFGWLIVLIEAVWPSHAQKSDSTT